VSGNTFGSEEEAAHDRASVLTQKLTEQEDDRKALSGRLQFLEAQLQEKEQALVLAGGEMAAATEELVKTRKELQRWKQELAELRDKLRRTERDDKEALRAAIRMLEQMVERATEGGPRRWPPEPLPEKKP